MSLFFYATETKGTGQLLWDLHQELTFEIDTSLLGNLNAETSKDPGPEDQVFQDQNKQEI